MGLAALSGGGCECRALRCPPAFEYPYDSLRLTCLPLILKKVTLALKAFKSRGLADIKVQ